MKLTLNIYKNSKEIEKTYTATDCDIMFGTCENLVNLMDFNFKNNEDVDNVEFISSVTNLIRGSFAEVKNILMEVFPDITDDELKRIKMSELVPLILDIVKFTFSGITKLGKKK